MREWEFTHLEKDLIFEDILQPSSFSLGNLMTFQSPPMHHPPFHMLLKSFIAIQKASLLELEFGPYKEDIIHLELFDKSSTMMEAENSLI